MYRIEFSDAEMQFLSELVKSNLAITISNVEIVAGFKAKVLNAKPAQIPLALASTVTKEEAQK